jgi:hypothetical protein
MIENNVNPGDFIGETDFLILSAGHARFGFVLRAHIRIGIDVVAHHDADLVTAFVGADFIVPTFRSKVIFGRFVSTKSSSCAQVIVSTLPLD